MQFLSTKKLNKKMKIAFKKNNINVEEIPMIKTTKINFIWPEIQDAVIITSASALKSIIKHPSFNTLKKHPFFCVGSYTKERLIRLGVNIELCDTSAESLATKIVNQYRHMSFNYFCGKQRLKTIEKFAEANRIIINICVVYETIEIQKKINKRFDGIIFFSPSAVRSYASVNSLENQKVFSWGQTTGKEIEKYCDTYFTSKSPSIKSLILLIKKNQKINA